MAIGFKKGSPPGICAIGSKPATVVKVVKMTGLKRDEQASTMASNILSAFSAETLMKFTSTIESLTTTPINPITPISAINPKGKLKTRKAPTTPMRPNGIDDITIRG